MYFCRLLEKPIAEREYMPCRLLHQGDLLAAQQQLDKAETLSTGVFSPNLRAQQLYQSAFLAYHQLTLLPVGSKESSQCCLKALCSCEWARALAPAMWRQVSTWLAPLSARTDASHP